MGEVILSWDDEQVERDAIVSALGSAGFHPLAA
jgi:hypothetical protein